MHMILLFSLVVATSPKSRSEAHDQESASAQRVVVPAEGCTVIIFEGGRRPCSARRPYGKITPLSPAPRTSREARRSVDQVTVDPGEEPGTALVPGAPAGVGRLQMPGLYARHTSTLFPTAMTLEKGEGYADFQLLGLYSGFQYGLTHNLELSVKMVIPSAIAAGVEKEAVEGFLRYGIHVAAKYRIYESDHFHLSLRAALPVPGAEIVGTVLFGNFDLTAALGTLAIIEDGEETDINRWVRWTLRYKASSKVHFFAENLNMRSSSGSSTDDYFQMFTFAARIISGNFSTDVGAGALHVTDSRKFDFYLPALYVNFGYAY